MTTQKPLYWHSSANDMFSHLKQSISRRDFNPVDEAAQSGSRRLSLLALGGLRNLCGTTTMNAS